MVPKVAAKGRSFKGAALYYLHDKQAKSAERVALTQTVNLPTSDPHLAIRVMAHTAMHQAELKAAAGMAKTGRKLTQSVYSYSLSWHPDQEPTHAQMIEAARETLSVLGLEKHEALLVIHNDEPHKHIHVIVNRVNPENGLAAKLSKDHLNLSRWAEEYEKKNGKILCEQRVENNRRRREGEFVRDRRSLKVADFLRWRRARLKERAEARREEIESLSSAQKARRKVLYDAKEARIAARRQEITAQFKPYWHTLYQHQKRQRDELAEAQRSAFSRLVYWMKTQNMDRWGGSQMDRRGMLKGALEAVLGRTDFATSLLLRQDEERKTLARKVNERSREAIAQENQQYRDELDILDHEHREEMRSLQEEHSRRSQEGAREIREGTDLDIYAAETGKTVTESFRERVEKAYERNKRILEEKRQRERDGGRERE